MKMSKVCVLGTGIIGYQIAQITAQSGYSVTLRDIEAKLLDTAIGNIKKNLQKYFVEKGKISQEQADETLARLKTTTDLAVAVSDADLVIEAIPEVLSLKQEVFKALDDICPENTILASNTSALSIDDIGLYAKRKDKILVTHFFSPVQRMKLVELVVSKNTSSETLNRIENFARSIGKETVLVKNSPGFVTTRLFVTLVNEAAKMFDEGIATAEDIDKAIILGLNHPIGPLQAADINIETLIHCLRYLKETLGESYSPSPILEKMVKDGKLGVKSGQGFYKYKT